MNREEKMRVKKKKEIGIVKLLFFMAAALLAEWLVPVSVYAKTETSGTMNGGAITWQVNAATGEITFSGKGSMDDMWDLMIDYERPWDYEKIKYVVIGEGITHIGSYTFDGAENLQNISLPKSLRTIGEAAFSGCSKITAITVPEGVQEIGNSAFSSMSGLKTISLPLTLKTIGKSAFRCCEALTEVKIPDGVTFIGEEAFYRCSKLRKVHLPEGLMVLSDGLFQDSGELREINIPEGCTTIGNSCFTWCDSLKVLTIPASVKTISLNGLTAPNLQTVYFMGKAPSFDSQCFRSRAVHAVILRKYASTYSKVKKQYPNVIWQVTDSGSISAPLISGIRSVKYDSIKISWKGMTGVSGFEIFRSTKKNSGYKIIKSIKKRTVVSYIDKGLITGKTYYYKVRAFSGTTKGALTVTYKIRAVPEEPKISRLIKTGNKYQAKVSWKKTKGANGYEVYRSYKFNGPYIRVATTASSRRFAVVTGAGKQHNYYKVRAFRTVKGKKIYGGYSYPKSVYFTSTGS